MLFQIEYQKKIYIQSINIYETNKGGSAWRISFKGLNGNWLSVWEVDRATLSTVMTSSRIFSPTIQVMIKKYSVFSIFGSICFIIFVLRLIDWLLVFIATFKRKFCAISWRSVFMDGGSLSERKTTNPFKIVYNWISTVHAVERHKNVEVYLFFGHNFGPSCVQLFLFSTDVNMYDNILQLFFFQNK